DGWRSEQHVWRFEGIIVWSSARGAGRFFSVPKKCWCGELMVTLTSKSDQNPYQRYLRCSFAAENKLQNDNHIFKWADEALLNEVDTLLLIFCVFYSSRD
uniref:GRF-type domain-containing protein n=1 Tax=Brassica oleracea var. oleracea TaxID=109376 RepID=A0A0D3AAP2_BRAOL